jgi:hypothetical protein
VNFASQDFDRVLTDETRLSVHGLRNYGELGDRFIKAIIKSAREHFADGVHDVHRLRANVAMDLIIPYSAIGADMFVTTIRFVIDHLPVCFQG